MAPLTTSQAGFVVAGSVVLGCVLLSCSLNGCSAPKQRLIVFAASSLTGVFAELEREFERVNPKVDVVIHTAGSQALRFQVEQGASADVFASADLRHVSALSASGHLKSHKAFATNSIVLVVPERNPSKVTRLDELSAARRVVMGHPTVPIGRYGRLLLTRAGLLETVEPHVVSLESNVKLVLAKVELGEADAAFVYASDLKGRRVKAVAIPANAQVRAEYHFGVLKGAQPLGERWVDFVLSPTGQRSLKAFGFEPLGELSGSHERGGGTVGG